MPAEVVRIYDPLTGASAEILVSQGFNCFRWIAPFANGGPIGAELRDMLWAEPGFEVGDKRPSRSGNPLLFPFPGRIARGVFEFGGQHFEVAQEDGLGNAIHGFAVRSPWRVVERETSRVAAEFRPAIDCPEAVPQWPGDYTLRCEYRIAGGRLDFDVEVTNVGETPVPFGFGTHAYFRLPLAEGSDPEGTIVRAPVDGEWESVGLIPTGKRLPLADTALADGAPLAGRTFDTPFRVAEPQATGPQHTDLYDPQSGRRLRQTFDSTMTCCVLYTPGHREAICLEPYTCTPNPFAMDAAGVASGLRVLAPGEVYRTTITLQASTLSNDTPDEMA
ncbi:MAG: aldose 1-epimerase [Lacipirellulaceae bacterium]